jgi:hypothetical protein
MFSENLFVLQACLPCFTQTFGASTTILSPIFNLLLLAAAVIFILHLLSNAQPNSFIKNLFAGYGALSMFSSVLELFNNNSSPNYQQNRPYSSTPRIHGNNMFFDRNVHHHCEPIHSHNRASNHDARHERFHEHNMN